MLIIMSNLNKIRIKPNRTKQQPIKLQKNKNLKLNFKIQIKNKNKVLQLIINSNQMILK